MSEYIYDWTPNKQHRKEEIVRCRDCRWLDDSEAERWDNVLAEMYGNPPLRCGAPQWSTASLMPPHEVEPDGFCAWGERKGTNDD